MVTHSRFQQFDLANANMNVEEPRVFRCSQCKHECRKAHIDSSSPDEKSCGRTLLKPQMLFLSPALNAKLILFSAVIVLSICAKKTQKRIVFVPKGRCLCCAWERTMSRKITTTRKVHPRSNLKKEKGDGAHRAKKEVGNPVMGVMWLTMGKVIFAPLLAAGASMSAVGVTLGKCPGPPGSSSQPRATLLHR